MHRGEVSTNNQRDASNNHDCATTPSAASDSHNNAIQRILKERKNENGQGRFLGLTLNLNDFGIFQKFSRL